MKDFNQLLLVNNSFYTGRASTAIYLILLMEDIVDATILLPANICYAAVFPVIYSKNKPVFLDIDDDSNLSLEIVQNAVSHNAKCLILPHMYGNPVKDIKEICSYCKNNGILVIEDCASSMGACIDNDITGSFGDYSIFSFGHSKVIDVGFGGLVLSKRNLSAMSSLQENLKFYNQDIENCIVLFSQIYRLIRNSGSNSLINSIYERLPELLFDTFLFRINELQVKEIEDSITLLPETVHKKWDLYCYYLAHLQENGKFSIIEYSENAVPWRISLLVEPQIRQLLIKQMLLCRLPISDWYPSIASMFGDSGNYAKTDFISSRIVNFPLSEYEEILSICDFLNSFFKAV